MSSQKYVYLQGGMGNNLFQIAFALYLEEVTHSDIRIVLRDEYYLTQNLWTNSYNISEKIGRIETVANGGLPFALWKKLFYLFSLFSTKMLFEYRPHNYQESKIIQATYLLGYWQNRDYTDMVNERMREYMNYTGVLSERTRGLIKTASRDTKSVFIGIRLGDYTLDKMKRRYGSFDITYITRAIDFMNKEIGDPSFLVFSNDIKRAKELLKNIDTDFVFVDGINSHIEEFEIMRSCANGIIMNSTYHWWAANLIENPSKLIVAPRHWFANGWSDYLDNEKWIQI